jgi:hypothetical protein
MRLGDVKGARGDAVKALELSPGDETALEVRDRADKAGEDR